MGLIYTQDQDKLNQTPVSSTNPLPAGASTSVAVTFTRPADTTAYASGDLVANSTTAGSVTPMSFTVARTNDASFSVRRARITTSSTSVTNASFRLHLYQSSPTAANGDNSAWSTTTSGYLGAIDVTVDKAFSDGAGGTGVPLAGGEMTGLPTSGARTIFGLLEARAAYTPTSAGTFTVTLEVLQN